MKELYEKIKNDANILSIYNNIHIYEDKEAGWAYHDYNHVLNVSNLAEKILKMFDFDMDFIYAAKIAALLHDTGALQGKDNHAFRSFEFAKKYFSDNNIDFEHKDAVLEAIKIHSDGFETNNMLALAIILSDKLDVKYTRVAEAGKNVEGNRQYMNIADIDIYIENNKLTVNFITNGKLDLNEFLEYYFTKKIFKAVDSFSIKINKQYMVMIDEHDVNKYQKS